MKGADDSIPPVNGKRKGASLRATRVIDVEKALVGGFSNPLFFRKMADRNVRTPASPMISASTGSDVDDDAKKNADRGGADDGLLAE